MTLKLVRIARLKQFSKDRKLAGPVQLGEAIGRKTNQASDLLNGRASFGEKIARSIEDFAGLPPGWLDVTDGPAPIPSVARASKDLVIPQFDAGGGMGDGKLLLDDQPGVIKSWHVDNEWLRQNVRQHTGAQNLCIVTGFGPSMRPMFNPGDPLLVDRGVTVCETDAIYFFRIGKHGFIKALQRIPVGNSLVIRAKSKNPDYDPFDITEDMDFAVLGKVLTVWKSEQF